jgi:hypothetical protein
MISGVNKNLIITEHQYNTQDFLDSNAYWNQKHHDKPTVIHDSLTWMLGSYDRMTSLVTLEGQYGVNNIGKKVLPVESDGQYEYPIIGDIHVPFEVAETPASLIPNALGIGNNKFKVKFKTNGIKATNVLHTPNGVIVRTEGEGVKVGNNFEYTFQIMGSNDLASVPPEDVKAGALWTCVGSATSDERSYGSGVNTVSPGKIRNQIGYLQMTMRWGNAENLKRVIKWKYNVDGKEIENWMSWYIFHFEKEWMRQCEYMYWYSRYNRNPVTNLIQNKDTTNGEFLPMGAGLLEQIGNKSTYAPGTLTADYLLNKMTAAFSGQYDNANTSMTLYTGDGGYREFNQMVERYYGSRAQKLNIQTESSHFLSGNDYKLAVGGYFNEIMLIDGYVIKIKKSEIFNHGSVAKNSKRHPVTHLPMESYRMVFIDDSSYDGSPNINFVSRGTEGYTHSFGLGHTDAPADLKVYNKSGSIYDSLAPQRSSEDTSGYYTRKKSLGINLRRPNKCFMLEAVMA